MHPYRWHILTSLAFLMVLTFIFFALASARQDKISIVQPTTTALSAPTVSIADPQIGAENPTVTIIEFADFSCDACKTSSTTLAQLLNTYPDDVRIVWKDFPNETKDAEATIAAVAARCAAEQGAFWQYHDELYSRQSQLSSTTYANIAEALELNTTAFNTCLTNSKTLPLVRKSFEEGLALSITATPTLFINGERSVGAVNLNDLEQLVKSAKTATR